VTAHFSYASLYNSDFPPKVDGKLPISLLFMHKAKQ